MLKTYSDLYIADFIPSFALYGDCTKYCVGLGFVPDIASKYPDYTTGVEELTVEDATEYIRKLDEERIVHAVSALRVPYVGMICNCDLRVCSPYRYLFLHMQLNLHARLAILTICSATSVGTT
jgi:hypothetical protein